MSLLVCVHFWKLKAKYCMLAVMISSWNLSIFQWWSSPFLLTCLVKTYLNHILSYKNGKRRIPSLDSIFILEPTIFSEITSLWLLSNGFPKSKCTRVCFSIQFYFLIAFWSCLAENIPDTDQFISLSDSRQYPRGFEFLLIKDLNCSCNHIWIWKKSI